MMGRPPAAGRTCMRRLAAQTKGAAVPASPQLRLSCLFTPALEAAYIAHPHRGFRCRGFQHAPGRGAAGAAGPPVGAAAGPPAVAGGAAAAAVAAAPGVRAVEFWPLDLDFGPLGRPVGARGPCGAAAVTAGGGGGEGGSGGGGGGGSGGAVRVHLPLPFRLPPRPFPPPRDVFGGGGGGGGAPGSAVDAAAPYRDHTELPALTLGGLAARVEAAVAALRPAGALAAPVAGDALAAAALVMEEAVHSSLDEAEGAELRRVLGAVRAELAAAEAAAGPAAGARAQARAEPGDADDDWEMRLALAESLLHARGGGAPELGFGGWAPEFGGGGFGGGGFGGGGGGVDFIDLT
jgi:uncharacterized membrane protein YgcG